MSVEVAVSDTGHGLTDEIRERLFLPFNSTKQRGTGLGLSIAAKIAQEHDITIAFEPEQANIVDSAQKARELLDTLRSKHVKVLMDAANLLTVANLPQQEQVLRNAFELLGRDIVAAHAKEFSQDGTLGNAVLGSGAVDFPLYTSLLRGLDLPVSLIMHGFAEQEAAASLRYLQSV